MSKRSILLACLLAAGLTTAVHAHVPKKVAYQGYLATAAGAAVNDTVSVTFRLYTTASGGSPIWAETQSVAVANGLYTVTLGAETPLDLDFASPLYLGVSVGADPEMTPRQALSSVPYALRALSVEEGAVGAGAIVDGSISPSKLASCGVNEILKYTGSTWACSADADTVVAPGNSVTAATSFGQASAAGSSAQYARADHTHGTPTLPAIPTPANSVVGETAPGLLASPGSSAQYSRADHTHGTPVLPVTVYATTNGAVSSTIAGGAGGYVFAGPVANVSISSSQTRIVAVISAVLGTASGTANAQVSLCSQPSGGGSIVDLAGTNYMGVQVTSNRQTYTVSLTRNNLTAGAYNVGFCVLNSSAVAISNNDYMQGWIQTVNP
jgi:hypothetical protein